MYMSQRIVVQSDALRIITYKTQPTDQPAVMSVPGTFPFFLELDTCLPYKIR